METKVIYTVCKTVEYKSVKLKVCNFTVLSSYTDGKLTSQLWSVKYGFKTTHPNAFEANNMRFAYYEDISFLNSETNSNLIGFYDEIPEPTLIENWAEFKGFDHVLSVRLSMDGNIYKINDPQPVSLWRHQDYLWGFCNNKYDLNKVESFLKRKSWIRDVKQIEIPYYDSEDDKTRAVVFDYKLPSYKDFTKKLGSYKIFSQHCFRQ